MLDEYDAVFEYLPCLVIVYCLVAFSYTPWLSTLYIIFVLLDYGVNITLKRWIKDPRPREWSNTKDPNYYGMPSGHTEMVALGMGFLSFSGMGNWWIVLGLLCFVFVERWVRQKHTILQLMGGIMVGMGMAYLANQIWRIR